MTAPSPNPKYPTSSRALLVALNDVILAAVAFELSVWMRYLTYGAPQEFGFLWQGTLIFTGVAAVSFWAFGLYRGIWYYASFNDIIAILKAVSIATLVFLPIPVRDEPAGRIAAQCSGYQLGAAGGHAGGTRAFSIACSRMVISPRCSSGMTRLRFRS